MNFFKRVMIFGIALCSALYSKEEQFLVSICSVFENEDKFLKEWVEYHQLIGFEHFYLYRISQRDHSSEILRPYIERGLVTLVNWYDMGECDDRSRSLGMEIPAYQHAIKYKAKNKTKWMIALDVNEFVVPLGSRNISDLLQEYEEYSGLILESDSFDASSPVFPQRKLLIETTALSGIVEKSEEGTVEKTIFKPECVEGFFWPPYRCNFKKDSPSTQTSRMKMRVNRYVKRFQKDLFSEKRKNKLHADSRNFGKKEIKEFCDFGYEIDDCERVIHQFVPELLEKMGMQN